MADEEMNIAIPVPRDRNGRITLSDAQWTDRLDRATSEAVEYEGGFAAWRVDRVTGQDEKGNVMVRLLRREPHRPPAERRAGSEQPGRGEAARAEAARREAHRQRAREQQRGEQGRGR